jgi:hypothetical protein
MTTPRDEPAPIEETGVGWPGAPPPAPAPKPPAPPPARPAAPPASPRPAPPRRSYQVTTPPQRPGTVTAAAVILFVGAGLALLACCGLNLLASDAELAPEGSRLVLLISGILGVSGVLNLVFGYFLLQGRQWARITTIVLSAIGIVLQIVGFVTGGETGSTVAGSCVGILLNIIVIRLLSGSSASEYFRASRAWR